MTDPTVAELLRTLNDLTAAFGTVREELARQDERGKASARAAQAMERRIEALHEALVARKEDLRGDDFRKIQDEVTTLRTDVDQLLHTVKPNQTPGMLKEQRALKEHVLRFLYGVGGVLFLLGVASAVYALYGALSG